MNKDDLIIYAEICGALAEISHKLYEVAVENEMNMMSSQLNCWDVKENLGC